MVRSLFLCLLNLFAVVLRLKWPGTIIEAPTLHELSDGRIAHLQELPEEACDGMGMEELRLAYPAGLGGDGIEQPALVRALDLHTDAAGILLDGHTVGHGYPPLVELERLGEWRWLWRPARPELPCNLDYSRTCVDTSLGDTYNVSNSQI